MDNTRFRKVYDIRPNVSGFARIAPPLPDGKGGNSRKTALINSFLKTKAIQILEGTISRIYWGSQGRTWPMFELTTDDGETSQWTREGDEDLYRLGQRARIHYYVHALSNHEVSKRVSEGWNPDFVREKRTEVVEIHLAWS